MPSPFHHQFPQPITGLLRQAAAGGREALDSLLPMVYGELEGIAHRRLTREATGHTLDTGALVHEAWLRLIGQHRASYQDRNHFFAVASEAMRRILVDHARQRRTRKRGSARVTLPLESAEVRHLAGVTGEEGDEALLALDEALSRLARINPHGARVVQCRYFAGLSNAEVADVMGTSERTVRRTWTAARAWLRRELLGEAA